MKIRVELNDPTNTVRMFTGDVQLPDDVAEAISTNVNTSAPYSLKVLIVEELHVATLDVQAGGPR